MEHEENVQQKNAGQFVLEDEVSREVAQIIQDRMATFNCYRREKLKEIQANIAYLVGEQNIGFDNGHIVPIKNIRAVNPVTNLILPAVQKDVAVATQNPPHYDIVPAGTDDDDKATAIAAQKIFQHLTYKNGQSLNRQQVVLWYDIAGIGWRKQYWDPNARVMGVNPSPEDENGNPNPGHNPNLPVGEPIMQGEVVIEVIPPTQLVYDFRETNLSKIDWIIHAKRVTRQFVHAHFGAEVAEKLQSQFSNRCEENEFELMVNRRLLHMAFGDEQQQTMTQAPQQNNIKLAADKFIDYYEYWQKPSKQCPLGMEAVMLGTQVVFHGPYPIDSYPHGEIPFVPTAPMSLGAGFIGAPARISQARPLQRRYNRVSAMIDENIDVMGNAVMMAPRQAKLKYKTLDNGAGNIIEYDGPMNKPHREPGVPLNSQAFAYLNEIRQAMEILFAFNDVTRGVAPRNVESGRGIMALQDADRVHMMPLVMAFEEADQKVAYQALSLALTNYEQNRLVHVVGSDHEWTLYEVDKSQMLGRFNVLIKPLSSMPVSKETEAQKAFGLWQSGLLGDPADPSLRLWTLEQMSLGNQENILQRHSKQKNFAQKEFSVAYQSVKEIQVMPDAPPEVLAEEIKRRTFVPVINPFDDDMVHLASHNEFLLDKFWDLLEEGNPILMQLLQNLMLHTQMHEERIMVKQQQQFQQQLQAEMLVKGTTPAQLALRKARPDGQKEDKKGK